ncbi:MAG: hypothetical protein JNL70_04075 [Saprospiraceae bacterium]|nr:hypothetical protein [Saprospiraceae bacterium]
MKNLLKILLLTFIATSLFSCRSEEFDPKSGLMIQLDIQAEIINSNPMKANEAFEKTYAINLRDTFAKRYNIDPDKLDSFFVNTLIVSFNQDRCKQLKTYEVNTDLPVVGNYSVKDVCDLTLISGKPAVVEISANSNLPFAKDVLKTNFADAIKKGQPFNVKFKAIAKEDFASGFGLSIILATRANYKP